ARKFVQTWNSYGPAHHWAGGTGHIANKLKKLGALLNIEVIQV
ncbi:MAG: arabinose isomerase, partial [Adhaeribacter sp.]|nr:arabinose isomerase [Adhaeribacter sp.]